ncbi:MAG: exonuclease SbcCD subunit D [Anaerolineales bacterium]|nr:exonuclease SbcCD subunit D [Anaerolineales bacterium]
MSQPIRVLHFADLHVGMENYGKIDPATGISTRIQDFLNRLDEVAEYARTHDADLILFAGDAFKTRDPDPTQQREFARRIKQMAEVVPVFLLVGNHDVPGQAARATSIDIFTTLDVPNIIVGRKPDVRVIETQSGPLFLAWMPFPVRSRLLVSEELKGASVEELDRALEARVSETLADFAQQAAEKDMPRVLAGHFSVGGAEFGSERSVMAGRDLVIAKSALANPAWDYVALGHIHKHQDLTANERGEGGVPPVVYSGSLERIDFGEAAQPKGFCWLNVQRAATTWEFVRVQARPFYVIEIDARGEADPTQTALDKIAARSLKDAVVRVTVEMDEGQEPLFRKREVEQALSAAGVANIAGITVKVERTVRVPGVGGAAESLTPAQWLERYFHAKNKTSERAALLLQAAETLLGEE